MTFEEWFAGVTSPGVPPLVPGWLRGRIGKLFLSVVGFSLDILTQDARAAVVYRLPSYAPSDVLPYVGDGRSIDRYFSDTTATYRARVKAAWDLWFAAGSKQRLIDAVTAMGWTGVRIYSYNELGGSVPTRFAGYWSAFWVFIDNPGWVTDDGTWDSGGTWDDVVPGHNGAPSGPGTWDTNISAYEVNQLREGIRKWKCGHEIAAEIVWVTGDIWEPVAPWDHGNWDDGTGSIRIIGYIAP